MKVSSCVLAAALCLLAASCGPRVVSQRPTIGYVEEVLGGVRSRELAVLENSAVPEPAGDICIIGSLDACYGYADYLAVHDIHDNVSGAGVSDELPDFAGETIACIADDGSFSSYVSSADTLELRRQTVMRVISALDTVLHITPYDVDGYGGKRPAKLIVLADPCLSVFGGFDVDTMMTSAGNHVPVVSSLDLMLDEVFAAHPGRTLNVGIIYDPEIAPESVYRSGFRAAAQRNGAPESVCVPFPAHRRDSLVHKLVERYAEGGAMMPLDAVIVDDPRVAPDSVKTELADIVSVMNESSLTYGRMLSRDFRLVHGFDAVAGYCYDLLRRHNMFTHNIAFPEILLYRPVVNPDSAGGDIILIPDLYVQN